MYKNLAILISLALGAHGCSDNHNVGTAASEVQPNKQADGLESIPDPSAMWYKARMGSWECTAPKKNTDETLICSKDKRVIFLASDDSYGINVSIPLSTKNNEAKLSLTDRDKDGEFENLYYDGTSNNKEVLRIARDDNLDGIIDRVIDLKSKKSSVRIDNAWIELENVGRDIDGFIIYKGKINGNDKRVIFKNYPYQVVDLPVDVSRTYQTQQ